MADRKPHLYRHLSATQINMFLRCPRQWAYRYVEHIKTPPSGAMKQSSVWHGAVERNYLQKIETRTDLPLDDMTDFYAESFEQEFEQEQVVLDAGDTPGKLKDQGIAITKAHHLTIAPTIQPVMVEHKQTLHLGRDDFGYDLMIIVDLVDEAGFIRDNKAMGRTPNQSDLDRDIQLSTYALGYRLTQHKAEAGLKIDAVIKTKQPKALTMETARSREGLKMHLNTIGHIARAIHAEAFPMNPTGWWCSQKFCGYWDRCFGRGLVTIDLKQQLEQSIEKIRTEREDSQPLPERVIDGSDRDTREPVETRGSMASSGFEATQQIRGDAAGIQERSPKIKKGT